MSARRRPVKALAFLSVGAVGALALGASPLVSPWLAAGDTAAAPADASEPRGAAARADGLAAAAAWSDALPPGAVGGPAPSATDTLIVVLDGAPAATLAPGARAEGAAALRARQAPVEGAVQALGGTVTAHWTVTLNGIAVSIPAGRGDAVAALDGVRSVAPVTYLSPAASAIGGPAPASARQAPAQPTGGAPAHVALIDTGIDPRAPQLGGGIGPTFPVIGGRDLVDPDGDPTVGAGAATWEGHGTQMAGLVLGSPALDDVPLAQTPRLLAYRVVAEEQVDGRTVPLARSDRVISAVEAAVDPNGDGDTSDRADVILLGLADAYAGGGWSPVAAALTAATQAGSVAVVPAGNDGPTYSRVGSLGAPAQDESVITVGGLADTRGPRTADLAVGVGPAAAVLPSLPLVGAEPAGVDQAPLVVLPGPGGVGTGDRVEDYQRLVAEGGTPVGAVLLVARGGGSLQDKAALAARAGAVGLVVWDRAGSGIFPSGAAAGGPVIPVVGTGPVEGQALLDLLQRQPGAVAALRPRPAAAAPEAIASFSSTGPTADGRIKPDLVAPAVQVDAPWAPGPDGSPRTAWMTGTSASAAQVAAVALRLRIARPDLEPAAVKASLVTGARPVAGARSVSQGAGALDRADVTAVRVAGGEVVAAAQATPRRVTVRLIDLTSQPGRYRVAVLSHDRRRLWQGPAITVPGGGTLDTQVRLPGAARGWSGWVVVRRPQGGVVARVPAATFPALRPVRDLERPRVTTSGGVTQAVVRIGRLARTGDRIRSAPLHAVRVELVPSDSSRPLVMAGVAGRHDWPAGTYRFVLSRRLPTGGEVPAGRYRLRVSGRAVDGAPRVVESATFTLN